MQLDKLKNILVDILFFFVFLEIVGLYFLNFANDFKQIPVFLAQLIVG